MSHSLFTVSLAARLKFLGSNVTRGIWLAALALGVAAATALPVHAQARPSQTATRDFDIPAGALGSALLRFGQQSGLQFSVGSELTKGKRSSGIKGKYTPEDGLRALLIGSGLTFRFTGPRTVVVEPLPDTGEARVLDPLRIEGADSSSTVSGANGSSDPTATENSGTYAAEATAFVSKSAQSVLDTPQTVSVMTRQQMSDQNIDDLASAMGQLPGITLRPGVNSQSFEYISRGFFIEKIRIDGGGPMTIGAGISGHYFNPLFDMAMFDHVELLRGADGMYSGYGNPGGVVNLVRKRPLDHNQVSVEAQVGSWNSYRTVVDVTGPLGFDGRLRGRAVFTYQDKDFFYDMAYDRHTLGYGVLEADVTPDLVLRGGFSLTNQSALPWRGGLPRYETGADLGLPRDTCLCFADAEYEMTNEELFLQAEYQFNPDWTLDVNLTRFKQQVNTWVPESWGGVNPDTGLGYGSQWTKWQGTDREPIRNSLDVALNGSFDMFGKEQKITFGANYLKAYANTQEYRTYTFGGMAYMGRISGIEAGNPEYLGFDVLHFDPNERNYKPYLKPLDAAWDEGNKEYTIYANWNTKLTDRLQLNLGFRYSYYSTYAQSEGFCNPILALTDNSCPTWGQNENGEWVEVGVIAAGESMGSSPKIASNVDRSFSWPPSWSLVYNISDNWSVYGSYMDTFVSQGSLVNPNRVPLPPETGFNAEFGSNFLSDDAKLNGKLSMYYIKKDGFAAWLYDDIEYADSHPGSWCCYIGGDNRNISYGLDLEVAGEIMPRWQVSVGYTFNLNTYEFNTSEFKSRIPLQSVAPRHMLKLWTTYQFNDGPAWLRRINVGGGVNMQTRTYDSGSICTEYEYGTDPVTGRPSSTCLTYGDFRFSQGFYAVYSARAEYRINDTWDVALNINNLFDKNYYARTAPPNGDNWYGEPRNFALTLRGQF